MLSLSRLSSFIKNQTGWWRWITAFISGVLTALALPPVYFIPIWLITLPILIWQLQSSPTKKQSFLLGWLWGVGYFTAGLYWISFALLVDLETWWWALPLAVLALPAILALYTGIATLITHAITHTLRLKLNPINATPLILVICLGLFEYLRGHLFTGFPWNLPGYSWMGFSPMAQNLSWMGIYGLSLLTLLWGSLPTLNNRWLCSVLIGLFVTMTAWGQYRLLTADLKTTDTILQIVQPNTPQQDKWDNAKKWAHFETMIDLSKPDLAKRDLPPSVIIWPETALTFNAMEHPIASQQIQDIVPKEGYLLSGDLRIMRNEDENAPVQFFNTLSAINDDGTILNTWHKSHLVPFGEYIPFRNVLNITPIGSLISGTGDFTAGTGPYTATLPHIPSFSPLICYEIIFPNNVTNDTKRPQWILNITNDAWYGNTSGPYQHFAITQARAIETGLPTVRVANTGISAIIDPWGRTTNVIHLNAQDYINAPLPKSASVTIYSQKRDILFFFSLFLLITIAFRLNKE